jgi:CRISPR-associated protein Csb2
VKWRAGLVPPTSRRPILGVWQGYRWAADRREAGPRHGLLDPRLLILRLEPRESRYWSLNLATTLRVTDVLRRAVLRVATQDLRLAVIPGVLSGHRENGAPLEAPHVAYFPLAFVSERYADGHLMGVAVALPRKEHWPQHEVERALVLTAIAGVREITLGSLGVWRLVPETSETPASALVPSTWTAAPLGDRRWASVTPLVFDVHPKEKDRTAREEALVSMIRQACTRAGLPEPIDVRPTAVPASIGAPIAREFPSLRRKDGSQRLHTHVVLDFAGRVIGPVLLGAGRYRGYGLCRPIGPHPEATR